MYEMFKNAYLFSVLQFDIRNSQIHFHYLIFRMIVRQIPNKSQTKKAQIKVTAAIV